VLVVGAANSGIDVAGLLLKAGAHVTLSMRSAPNIFPREWHRIPLQPLGIVGEHLPVAMTDRIGFSLQRRIYGDLTPYGLPRAAAGMLATFRDRRRNPAVDDGFIAALKEGRTRVVAPVAHLDGTAAVLSDGSRILCDAVICATGFARALEAMVGHLDVLGDDGVPRYERGVPANPATPGLYFAGFDATPTGQIRTIAIQARRIARDVTNRRGESKYASRTRPAWTERALHR
jgi:putative flavoprotein involved in K+ transport